MVIASTAEELLLVYRKLTIHQKQLQYIMESKNEKVIDVNNFSFMFNTVRL